MPPPNVTAVLHHKDFVTVLTNTVIWVVAVVALTDEPGEDTITPGAYATWLKSLKAQPSQVSFSGVTPPNSGFGCIAAPLPAP